MKKSLMIIQFKTFDALGANKIFKEQMNGFDEKFVFYNVIERIIKLWPGESEVVRNIGSDPDRLVEKLVGEKLKDIFQTSGYGGGIHEKHVAK
jgi:hypothetical protein